MKLELPFWFKIPKYEPIHTTNDWEVHFILPRQVIENEDDIIEYLQH